jgi:hypothetical protein
MMGFFYATDGEVPQTRVPSRVATTGPHPINPNKRRSRIRTGSFTPVPPLLVSTGLVMDTDSESALSRG